MSRPVLWLALLFCMAAAAPCKERRNVLFIVIADVNDWVGVLGGYDRVRIPNPDQLS
jgi:hypothetical protein